MDEAVRQKIAEAAATEQSWKVDEIRVDEVERLRRPACAFFTVAHDRRPLSRQANYALLDGETVLAISDADAVGKILDACGVGADAAWVAEIVTRFHGKLGAGVVLTSAERRPEVPRRLAAAGHAFAAPKLERKGDELAATFLVLDPESHAVHRVQATRQAKAAIDVAKTALL